MIKLTTLISFSAILLAQSGTSTISGIVKDPTGSPVPRAKVKIINEQTGSFTDQETNDDGLYRVGSLVPGVYRIEIEASGFEKVIRRPVTLEVGQVIAVDLILQVGHASETVNVTEAAPLVESQSSNVSQAVTRQ